MTNNLVIVEPGFISVIIPTAYLPTYYRLLATVIKHGEESIANKKPCKYRDTDVVDCFNLFNAAIASVEVNKVKLADLIISYINAKLDTLYPDVVIPEVEELTYNYIYYDVPAEYMFTFYALMQLLSEYGELMLKDCKASCNNTNANIIRYFNMFYSGLVSISNRKREIGVKLINNVTQSLKDNYPGLINTYSFIFVANNKLKILVEQGEEHPVFKIDEDDMELYSDIFKTNTFPIVFSLTFTT